MAGMEANPPLGTDEQVARLVSALLDPAVRDFVNATPRAHLELDWNADNETVTVVMRHTAKHHVKLRPPTLHSTR